MFIMDTETIESLLHRLQIDDCIDAFKEEDINLDLLLELSEKELKDVLVEMKFTIGKRLKILSGIKNLQSRK